MTTEDDDCNNIEIGCNVKLNWLSATVGNKGGLKRARKGRNYLMCGHLREKDRKGLRRFFWGFYYFS